MGFRPVFAHPRRSSGSLNSRRDSSNKVGHDAGFPVEVAVLDRASPGTGFRSWSGHGDVAQVVLGDRRDAKPLARLGLDQTFRGQARQRLAHRAEAEIDDGAQIGDDQLLARQQGGRRGCRPEWCCRPRAVRLPFVMSEFSLQASYTPKSIITAKNILLIVNFAWPAPLPFLAVPSLPRDQCKEYYDQNNIFFVDG